MKNVKKINNSCRSFPISIFLSLPQTFQFSQFFKSANQHVFITFSDTENEKIFSTQSNEKKNLENCLENRASCHFTLTHPHSHLFKYFIVLIILSSFHIWNSLFSLSVSLKTIFSHQSIL